MPSRKFNTCRTKNWGKGETAAPTARKSAHEIQCGGSHEPLQPHLCCPREKRIPNPKGSSGRVGKSSQLLVLGSCQLKLSLLHTTPPTPSPVALAMKATGLATWLKYYGSSTHTTTRTQTGALHHPTLPNRETLAARLGKLNRRGRDRARLDCGGTFVEVRSEHILSTVR